MTGPEGDLVRDRCVIARYDGGSRVHLVHDNRTACGRRLAGLAQEWGTTAQVTCRDCRRRLEVGR